MRLLIFSATVGRGRERSSIVSVSSRECVVHRGLERRHCANARLSSKLIFCVCDVEKMGRSFCRAFFTLRSFFSWLAFVSVSAGPVRSPFRYFSYYSRPGEARHAADSNPSPRRHRGIGSSFLESRNKLRLVAAKHCSSVTTPEQWFTGSIARPRRRACPCPRRARSTPARRRLSLRRASSTRMI